jgi:antitoxin ParD1/3/4
MTEIHLDEKHRAFIDEQVSGGVYRNAEDVVRAGLSLLETKQGQIDDLRRAIADADGQIARGEIIEVQDADAYARSVIERGIGLSSKEG